MASIDLASSSPRFMRIAWNASADESAWIEASAGAIAVALRGALDGGDDVHLLLSGGTTPAPVYRRLATVELDWSRVIVRLVDDRDAEPDAQGSNARLIRETLLQGFATAARFELLRGPHESIEDAVRKANTRWHEEIFLSPDGVGGEGRVRGRGTGVTQAIVPEAPSSRHPASSENDVRDADRHRVSRSFSTPSPQPFPPTVKPWGERERTRLIVVLGMGDDGHTASLFPGAVNLDAALASSEPYAAIDATGCKVAGDYPQRISLTPSGLARSAQRFLLIRGAAKRVVLEHALQEGDVREMPIRSAIDLPGAPLHVHWCD